VTCKYQTEDGSAVAPHDYEGAEGEIVFDHNQITTTFELSIKGSGRYESTEEFRVVLSDPTAGAEFPPE
jgi:hypothetical protein